MKTKIMGNNSQSSSSQKRSSFTSLSIERERPGGRFVSSSGSSAGEGATGIASSTSSGGDKGHHRNSMGSSCDSGRSPSEALTPVHLNHAGQQCALYPNLHPRPSMHRGSIMSQRGSISSRVSSLTKDSSVHSLDPLKIEIADLTHIFGRSKEQDILQTAFQRCCKHGSEKRNEVVWLHGHAGTGKTALIIDFKDAVTATGMGYFCSGKFEQYQSFAKPYSGIIQALNDLCEAIAVGPDKDHQRISLREKLGYMQLKEIYSIFPKLSDLILGHKSRRRGDDSSGSVNDGRRKSKTTRDHLGSWSERVEELPDLFLEFLKALSGTSHPIILSLDDLQWADEPSLECIKSFLMEPSLQNLMFVGAYRDEEVLDVPFLMEGQGCAITDIRLENLNLTSVDDILSDLTGTPSVTDLAEIVLEKTHGNPFSIFQFLEMLQRKELLVFSFHTHKWLWDVEEIKSKTEVTQNVGHLLVEHISHLQQESRKIMTLAAVIGFTFEPKVVEFIALHLELLDGEYREHLTNTVQGVIRDAVSGGLIHQGQTHAMMAAQMELVEDGSSASLKRSFYEESVQSAMHEAEVEGLVGKAVSRSKYKFSHDLLHKSFYEDMTLDVERHKLHLQIGRILRSFYSARPEDELLFAAVDHLNKGSHFLEDDLERIDLIELNQKSSEKARARSALFSAANFSSKAIDLLKFEHDWMNHYDLLLHVYNDAAELNFACGRFDLSLRRCLEIHRHARTVEDKMAASYIRVEVLLARRKLKEATESCMSVLKSLGETFEKKPSKFQLIAEWRKTRSMMKRFRDEDLLSLPALQDSTKRQTQRYLSLLANMCFLTVNNKLLPIVIFRMCQIALTEGGCDFTPFGFASFGMLCAAFGTVDEAIHYGKLAIQLCDKMERKNGVPSAYAIFYSVLNHVRTPLIESIEPLLRGYRVGIGNGEVQFAAICTASTAGMGFYCGLALKSYTEDLKSACDELKLLKQETIWALVVPYWLAAMDLAGAGSHRDRLAARELIGRLLTDTTGESDGQLGIIWRNYYMVMYFVSYFLSNYDSAIEYRQTMKEKSKDDPKGTHFMVFLEIFFSGLLDFAEYGKTKSWSAKRRARSAVRSMEKLAKSGAVNCVGMSLLLQAELRNSENQSKRAQGLYEKAIASFASSGFVHFQGIANERLAELLKGQSRSHPTAWRQYIRNAIKLYAEWGAAAKVNQLVRAHGMPTRFAMGETPCPVITIEDAPIRRFPPIQGHIKEEELMSSDFISSDMLTKKV